MRAMPNHVTDDVFVALVRSLFTKSRSLIIGSLVIVVAMTASFVRTNDPSFIILSLLFAAVTTVRLLTIMRFERKSDQITTRAEAAIWERSYAIGAFAAVTILGCWCFSAMGHGGAIGVQLLSFTLTMGYIIGIFGRNFGSSALVTLQIIAAWLPITAALVYYGDAFYWLFAALLVPLFLGIKFVSDRIRSTLLDAELARRAAEETQQQLARLNEKLKEAVDAAVAAQRSAEAEAREAKEARSRAVSMAKRVRQSRRNEAAAIQARDQHMRFLATMSHEIRTPLNGIVGALDLMTSAKRDRLPGLVDMAKLSADALLDIVTEVLDLSRLEYGHEAARSREYDLKAVINSVKLAMEPVAKGKGLSLSVKVSEGFTGSVVGDPAMVRQICMNLLGNALKFTESGFVQISLDLKRAGVDEITFDLVISDSGCGIEPKDQARIYEPFYIGGNKYTRGVGSSGLGLSIVRKTVEAMGGSIACDSRPGEGTTFTVSLTLPMGKGEVGQIEAASQDEEVTCLDGVSIRTLLVEDNQINAQIVQDFFEDTEIEIDWVRDGAEALEAIGQHDYDLVLMDISMPGMDGVEAFQRLRWMPGREETPKVIALTAHAVSGDRERYLGMGFDEYVAKPVRKAILERAIARVVLDAPVKLLEGTAVKTMRETVQPLLSGDLIDEDLFCEFVSDRGPERANDLLMAICDELQRKRDELEDQMGEGGDLDELARNFHNLASIVATVGAVELATVSRSCERMCADGRVPDDALMAEFFRAMMQLAVECQGRAQGLAVATA